MPYNEGDPARNPGVPLKLTMDVRDERFPRNTVAEVYGRIEKDLLTGNRLLTENDYKRNFLRLVIWQQKLFYPECIYTWKIGIGRLPMRIVCCR